MKMNTHSRLSASIVVKQYLSQLFTETEYMELVYGIIIGDVIRDIEECADEEFNDSDEFQSQINDSKSYNLLGFEERLGLLVDAEWNRRQTNKLKNLIKRAAFSVSSACIEDIEYIPDRKLDKAQMLRFSTCQYINEGHHIILKGATGSGKTYVLRKGRLS